MNPGIQQFFIYIYIFFGLPASTHGKVKTACSPKKQEAPHAGDYFPKLRCDLSEPLRATRELKESIHLKQKSKSSTVRHSHTSSPMCIQSMTWCSSDQALSQRTSWDFWSAPQTHTHTCKRIHRCAHISHHSFPHAVWIPCKAPGFPQAPIYCALPAVQPAARVTFHFFLFINYFLPDQWKKKNFLLSQLTGRMWRLCVEQQIENVTKQHYYKCPDHLLCHYWHVAEGERKGS